MKILNIYNVITNTSVPYELECHMADKFKSDNFSHIRLNKMKDALRCFCKTYRAIRDSDIIHSHHTFSSIAVSFYKILFVGRRKSFFCTVHRDYRSLGRMRVLVHALLVFPFRDKIICNSYSTKESLPWYINFFFKNRIVVVYNGINLSSISCSINFPSDKIKLINVGRLVPDKDQVTLIRMCSVLSKRNVDYQLTICGGGQLEEQLRQEIIKRGVADRVLLLGNISRSNVFEHLTNSSIYISTSLTEGFGNANIEAMAAGSPVVATDIPISSETINNKQLIFSVGDFEELTNKVLNLCNDIRYFRKMALLGVERSKVYSLDAAANSYHSLYTQSSL